MPRVLVAGEAEGKLDVLFERVSALHNSKNGGLWGAMQTLQHSLCLTGAALRLTHTIANEGKAGMAHLRLGDWRA